MNFRLSENPNFPGRCAKRLTSSGHRPAMGASGWPDAGCVAGRMCLGGRKPNLRLP